MTCQKLKRAVLSIVEGFEIKTYELSRGGKHYKLRITGPLGCKLVVIGGTSSDNRAMMNIKMEIRRCAQSVGAFV